MVSPSPPKCPTPGANCDLKPVSRERKREIVEEVIYVEQKIKKFDREGSETIEIARMPEFVEQEIEVDVITYHCDACGNTVQIRQSVSEGQ